MIFETCALLKLLRETFSGVVLFLQLTVSATRHQMLNITQCDLNSYYAARIFRSDANHVCIKCSINWLCWNVNSQTANIYKFVDYGVD